ncbi:14944_t:CDS:2, partial [Gigaspora rosea]
LVPTPSPQFKHLKMKVISSFTDFISRLVTKNTQEKTLINDISEFINSDTSDCFNNEVENFLSKFRYIVQLDEILSELSEPIVAEKCVSDSIALIPDLFKKAIH